MKEKIISIATEVCDELETAITKHKKLNSAHEGYAVILEELDELFFEVKKKTEDRDINKMREEAIQIAAMGMRFILDICGE